MSADSLKRLIMTLLGVALNLLAPKLGLSVMSQSLITGLLGAFLAQSGVNAALGKLAASKAGSDLQMGLDVLSRMRAALDSAKAAQALSAGQAAGAAPGQSPSGQ